MNKQLITSQIFLLIVSFIFGANYWISKSLMPDYLNPFQLLIIRTGGAAAIIWIIQIFAKKEKVVFNDLVLLAVCALFGIAFNQGFLYIGLNKTSPFDASIIHTANPLIVMLIAAAAIKEKITLLKSFGILLGLSGALFLILTSNHSSNNMSSLIGNLFIFANGASYAIYLVIVKPLMKKYTTMTVLKWVFLFGFLFSLPFTKSSNLIVNWNEFSSFQWFSLFYIIILNSIVAYFLIVYALKHVSASIVGYYTYLQPLIVAIIGIISGTEFPSWIKVFSAMLIFAGVYLINKQKSPTISC
jgi:drug/metabolite transporter (DMT)-like permease